MPTINTDPEYWGGVPKNFPRTPSELADMLEAGINAAWQGAGISTLAIHEATWALMALRQQKPAMTEVERQHVLGQLQEHFAERAAEVRAAADRLAQRVAEIEAEPLRANDSVWKSVLDQAQTNVRIAELEYRAAADAVRIVTGAERL